MPHLTHDLEQHALMLTFSKQPTSRCSVTGMSLLTLRKCGEQLSVDRIDNSKGYVMDNMRLLAASLNSAKGPSSEIPPFALRRLAARLATVKETQLDKFPTCPSAESAANAQQV